MPSLPLVPPTWYARLNLAPPRRTNQPEWRDLAVLFCAIGRPVRNVFQGENGRSAYVTLAVDGRRRDWHPSSLSPWHSWLLCSPDPYPAPASARPLYPSLLCSDLCFPEIALVLSRDCRLLWPCSAQTSAFPKLRRIPQAFHPLLSYVCNLLVEY